MAEQGPTIKVHCGPNLVFSCSKQPTDSETGGKTAALVSSLKDAQVRVNQFLTELVEKSGSSNHNEGGDEEASDEEDEEADGEDPGDTKPEAVKRKLEGSGARVDTSKDGGKRSKP